MARDLLVDLWGEEGDALERFETFATEVPTEAVRGRGVRANVLGLLLLAIDPLRPAAVQDDGARALVPARGLRLPVRRGR